VINWTKDGDVLIFFIYIKYIFILYISKFYFMIL
jgi:hypothetical protein